MTEERTGMLDDLAVRDQTRPERPGPDRTSPSLDGPAAAHHATRRAGTFVNDHEAGSLRCESDVHDQFGLSYASYLVVPRSLLQLMPGDWQHALVELLEEFGIAFPGETSEYAVFKRDREHRGRFVRDPLRNYRYPDEEAVAAAVRSDR